MRLMAVDPGFAATGLVILECPDAAGWRAIYQECIRTTADTSKKALRKADDDIERVQKTAQKIAEVAAALDVRGLLVELPNGGAQSGRAMRAMGITSGMMGTLAAVLKLPVEWYTPRDTRIAACGHPTPSKDDVMDAIGKRWPMLSQIPKKAEREHVADAYATFDAARGGTLVRLAAGTIDRR